MHIDSDKIAMRCIALALVTVILSSIFFWGDWIVLIGVWLMLYPIALLFGFISGFVGHALGFTIQDESRVWTEDTDIVILDRSETVIGLFQDEKIHEWIVLKRPDNGEAVQLMYERTIDMTKTDFTVTPPEETWFAILPPGIMYVEKTGT